MPQQKRYKNITSSGSYNPNNSNYYTPSSSSGSYNPNNSNYHTSSNSSGSYNPNNSSYHTPNESYGSSGSYNSGVMYSSVAHQLSPAERNSVNKLDNPLLFKKMREGDEALKIGKITKEAARHRFVQEELGRHNIYNRDDESLLSYAYNSALIHEKELVKEGLKKGFSFEHMFNLITNNNPRERKYNYKWIVPEQVIETRRPDHLKNPLNHINYKQIESEYLKNLNGNSSNSHNYNNNNYSGNNNGYGSSYNNGYNNNYNNSYNNYCQSIQSNGFSKQTNDLVHNLERMLGHY